MRGCVPLFRSPIIVEEYPSGDVFLKSVHKQKKGAGIAVKNGNAQSEMERKGNILIVDDEEEIGSLLEVYLTNEGYNTFFCTTGKEAWDCLRENEIDLALLDVMLPDTDGFTLCWQIRKKWLFPIIMLTAKVEEADRINGISLGADDYITKPFEIREVLARIQVQLRHIEAETKSEAEAETEAETEVIIKDGIQEGQGSGRLEFRDMVLTRSTFEVSIGGRVLPKITKQEFAILELLLKNPKQVFSKEDIFEYAWDEPYMGETKTLDVHISNIRKKIKTVTPDEYIETIWGIGYRLHE